MNKKDDPNEYIRQYFKENEWTTLKKEEEKKKYAYSKKNFKLIKEASKKVESSKFMWFPEEGSARNEIYNSESTEINSESIRDELFSSPEQQSKKRKRDTFSNCSKLAKVLFEGAKKNLNFLEKTLSTNSNLSPEIEDDSAYGPRIKRCYPRRNLVQQTSYKEEDLTSEDEYLHCDDCSADYKGACPEHGPMLYACDKEVSGSEETATGTLPDFLSIGLSSIPKAGLGVWTEVPLPKGVVFGPYLGHITKRNESAKSSGYAWQVYKGGKPLHFVEAEHTSESNWLRFVNCANTEDKQNLKAFQFKKQIYYQTYKPVLPYTELLVWYGDNYAQDLGIDITNKESEPLGEIDGHKCSECSSLFSTEAALTKHMKRHPHMVSDRKHKCKHCSYSTKSSIDLHKHLSSAHSEDKHHNCPKCDKSFKMASDLKRHLRTHSGDKRHACGVCLKTFVGSSDLIRHQRIHSDERPFRCPTCGRDFKQRIHLRRHERSHAEQRPYKCSHCDYRSIRQATLQSHMLFRHTKNFKHKCPHCEKGYSRYQTLQTHIEFRHFDTETYREMVKSRFIKELEAGIGHYGRDSLFIENVPIKKEEDDSGEQPEPKRAQLLPPLKIKFRKEVLPNPLLKYPRVVGSGNIRCLEDLRKFFFEKFKIENCIKKELSSDGEDETDAGTKDLKISILVRKERYLEASQIPNLDVLRDFRRMTI